LDVDVLLVGLELHSVTPPTGPLVQHQVETVAVNLVPARLQGREVGPLQVFKRLPEAGVQGKRPLRIGQRIENHREASP